MTLPQASDSLALGYLPSAPLYPSSCLWRCEHWDTWHLFPNLFVSVQFSSVAQSCPTLCDPMNHSTPGLPVHHQLPEFTQTYIHRVSDAIQPSHPLSSLFLLPPIPPSISLFQWVNSSHEVLKIIQIGFKKKGTYVHLWLIHADVWQKSDQHCETAINQLKINMILKR